MTAIIIILFSLVAVLLIAAGILFFVKNISGSTFDLNIQKENTQPSSALSNSSDGDVQENQDYSPSQPPKTKSDLPLGFRTVRKVSVTHCNEVI